MQNFKKKKTCMPAKLLLVQNWGKMAHLPQPTTRTSFGNFTYTTIVCSDYTPLSQTIQISSLEANLSLEDMKQFCVYRSHIHTGISPTPQN